MITLFLLLAALAVPDLAPMDAAVAKCDRVTVAAIFGAEPARRSDFMTALFTEQQAIFVARRDLEARRQALRSAAAALPKASGNPPAPPADSEAAIAFAGAALDDRQAALNDARALDALRREALDAKRRLYLAQCGGKASEQ